METQYFERFTSAYLKSYFKKKDIPNHEWHVNIDGINHILNNQIIIEQILNSEPNQQKLIAEALQELDTRGGDVKAFLRHLAQESLVLHSQ